jgi:hypothetical protein
MRFWGIAAMLCVASGPALAQEDVKLDVKPLTGDYFMAPAIDSDDPKAPADHINLRITGDAAKSMWDAMKVETRPDECIGRMSRWVESLVCYGPPSPESGGALAPDDSPYECYMGVDLKSGALALGHDC